MLMRYLLVVIALAAVGAGMLGLRQQQLAHMHAIAVMHGQMRDHREEIKDYQVRIEGLKQPAQLREAIDRLDLHLEPVGEKQEPEPGADSLAEAD